MSSDQQYPYDPERGHGAPHPHPRYGAQPEGAAYQPYQAYEPQDGAPGNSSDMESTQTFQGQTWDTASQPVVDRRAAPDDPSYPPQPAAPHGTSYPSQSQGEGPQAQSYGQPQQQGPRPAESYGQQPPYGQPAPQSQARPAAPYYGAPYAPAPQQSASMEETAYLAAPGVVAGAAPAQPSGAYPLPPEVRAAGPAAQEPYAAPTEALPPVPAHAGPAHAAPGYPGPGAGPTAEPASAPGPSTSAAAGYSAPTTVGNARITDAQRARAEGRSPIIPPGIQPAALTAVLGLLLAGAAGLGSYALLVPVVLLQAVTAAGWFRLNGMWPARQGIALAFLGGLVADVALLAVGRDNAPAAIIGTLGVWVLLTVVLQLRSHADTDTRLSGLFATVVSAALAIIATGFFASSSDAVVAGAVAVAATTVVRALPLPGPASVVASLVVAAGAGLVMGAVTDFGTKGVVLGLGAGVCALVGLRAASYDYPSRFVHMTAGVALPLTAAAPVVYLLGRALG